MKITRNICRILLGLVFIFSGFVKGIDPWGSAIKFNEYFSAFHLTFMEPLSMTVGILLAFIEFATGIALVLNIFSRIVAWVALIFMAFFTLLTFDLALTNAVTDCGCFGDAIKLTNWQTFFKNLVFILLALLIFQQRKQFKPSFWGVKRIQIIAYSIPLLCYAAICIYSYQHLPVIDFLPFKTGVNIPEAMQIPRNAPVPVYRNTFYYKNKQTGNLEKFDETNYPWKDSLNWEFVKMDEPQLISKGYEPTISNFTIQTPTGDDVKDFFLRNDNYTFIVVSYDITKSDLKHQSNLNKLAVTAHKNGMNFICLTASLSNDINKFKSTTGASYEFFQCDETTLKSMIRSNPGLILLRKGTILHKWHYNDIPAFDEIKELKK